MESGSVATWIGKGEVIPPRARAAARSVDTPRSAKLGTADMKVHSIRDDWRVSKERSAFDDEQDSQAAQ